jgi:tRNA A37 threonylcarbamoyladenosine biosynthesis protein TsaE
MPSTADGDVPPTVAPALTVTVPDEAALAPLARRLAAAMPARAFVALEGDLGAGKTTFVKAVAAAIGIDPTDVVSPTFGLIHVHEVPHVLLPDAATAHDRPAREVPERLVHADLYRLSGAGDLAEIGWDDATAGRCWVFVEWPSRAPKALPADRLDITITIDSEAARTFQLTPRGAFTWPTPP